MTNNNYPIYPSSTFASHLQYVSYTPSNLNNTLPQENHVTPITSNPQFTHPAEIPYNIANPKSTIPNTILNQEPQFPMVDSSHNTNSSTLPTDILTLISPCHTLKPQHSTLENHISFLTSLAYLTLKVEDWNILRGVSKMFDESIYPITRTKYKSPTETYLPGDFFPIFEEMQLQEEENLLISFGSLEHGSYRTISLLSNHPEENSKGSISVPSLSGVLLDINAKLGGLNSLLAVGQSKPTHHHSTTVSHSFARIRKELYIGMVVYVLPPLLLVANRRAHLELGDACVAKDKDADFLNMLK